MSSKNQTVCALALLSLLSFQLPVSAARLSFAPQTKDSPFVLSTTLPISKIGRLTIPGGLITIDSNAVEVSAVPEGLFDSRTVLTGVVVSASGAEAASRGVVRGQVYFFSGPWLNYLSLKPYFEVVEKLDGSLITGQIVEGSEQDLTVLKIDGALVQVPFNEIVNIESPRVQNFLLPFQGRPGAASIVTFGEAADIRFSSSDGKTLAGKSGPVALKRPINAPLGDEKGISRGTLGAYLATNLFWTVAPFVATPLVFGRSLAGPINRIKQANALSFPTYTGVP